LKIFSRKNNQDFILEIRIIYLILSSFLWSREELNQMYFYLRARKERKVWKVCFVDTAAACGLAQSSLRPWPRRHVNTPLENNFSNIFLSTTRNFPAEFSCLAAAGLGWAGLGLTIHG